jgi:hypothetical protein
MRTGGGQIITWDGTNGIAIQTLVGADRFYASGYLGQGTVTANVEAGLAWKQHETLTGVTQYTAPTALGEVDMHATWVTMMLGGFDPLDPQTNGYPYYKLGMAPFTDLNSCAIATQFYDGGSFAVSAKTFYNGYKYYFADHTWQHTLDYGFFSISSPGPADVINSSWGGEDPLATDPMTMAADGLARANPHTTFVVAAGNATTSANPSNNVQGPGSGYNVIAVGAVGDFTVSNFTTVSYFSSRGPQDYYDPQNGVVPGVRAPISLVAPGTSLVSAFYGGQTGGNGAQLASSQPDPSGGGTDWYSLGLAGTSFAAPIVAGGVALLDSASYQNWWGANSRDARVIKAVLLTSATKLPGWNNGQATNAAGTIVTTQSLDWSQGAGMLNLDAAYDVYLTGTADVPGMGGGPIAKRGWDCGSISMNANPGGIAHNDYVMTAMETKGEVMTVTLAWFRDRGDPVFVDALDPDNQSLTTDDIGMANLDLEVWDSAFTTLVATSMSVYNNTEHLYFAIPDDGLYAIRVTYAGQVFGIPAEEIYGLAWNVTPVPEPSTLALLLLAAAFVRRRRTREHG